MAKKTILKSPDPSHDSKVNKVDRRQTLLEQRLVIERSVSLSLRLKEAGDRLNQRREQMRLEGGAE